MDNGPLSRELLPPLRFADLEEGRHFGPTMFETSPELVARFTAVTGDDNPAYRDHEASLRLGFSGPILPPGLTGVWARQAYLAGHRMLPGGVMAGLTIELVRPTTVGTTLELHAEIELVDRDHPKQRVVLRSEAYDREGLTAKAWIDARWPPDNDKSDR